MKIARIYAGISSAALVLTATVVAVHFVAQAKESAPAIRVDSTPVNRAEGSGNSYAPMIKKIAPSVVNIYSTRFVKQRYHNPLLSDPLLRQFFGNSIGGNDRVFTHRDEWLGSGMIVTPDGYILTANHVVEGADEIKVGLGNDKMEYAAKIIGADPATDIAVLKIDSNNLPAITLGDSSQLEVGDVVLAIGNPFGLGQTVTRGIVSALGRSLPGDDESRDKTYRYQDYIQTDASINMGNSGGALVDAQGRLIGINDAIVSPTGTSAGIGFAVPINLARTVMDGFLNGGKLSRGYLGVDSQDLDPELARSFGVANSSGVLVTAIGPDSPAEKAGLKSGDVITSIGDTDVSGVESLKLTVSQLHPGSQAKIKLVRNGAAMTLTATLGEKQDSLSVPTSTKPANNAPTELKADALDGVRVQDLDMDFRQELQAPLTISGAVVTDVDNASNSAIAGLRRGDVIAEINHQPVTNAKDAVSLCKAAKSDQILVKVWRPNGRTRFISVNNTQRAK